MNNKIIDIDIVCPVYREHELIQSLYDSFFTQVNVNIKNVVFPLTDSGDEKTTIIEDFAKEKGIKYFLVKKEDFSHNLTREKAIKDYCQSKIVVMLTQDVKFTNENVLYNLVKDIDDTIVFTYARQIAKRRNIERYIREKNYPKESYVISKDNSKKYELMAFFASDACAAYNRDVFIKINGYGYDGKLPTNEDMLYSRRIIESGYSKKYCADAIVEHYHKYTLKQLYKRYYLTGQFFALTKEFDKYKKTDSGLSLAFYVLGQAFIHLDILVLFRWLPDMTARYLGMRKGRKEEVRK